MELLLWGLNYLSRKGNEYNNDTATELHHFCCKVIPLLACNVVLISYIYIPTTVFYMLLMATMLVLKGVGEVFKKKALVRINSKHMARDSKQWYRCR